MALVSVLLYLSAIAAYICGVFVAFQLPWVAPNISVENSFYTVSVSVQIGLLKCYSAVCHDYDVIMGKSIEQVNEGNNIISMTPAPITQGQELDPTTFKISTDEDGQATVRDEGFSPPSPSYLKEKAKQSVIKATKPFKRASVISLSCMGLSVSFLLLSMLHSFLCLGNFLCFNVCITRPQSSLDPARDISDNGNTGKPSCSCFNCCRYRSFPRTSVMLLTAAVVLYFFASMLYVIFTCEYLHGGKYIDGLWLTSYAILISLTCCSISFAWERDSVGARGFGNRDNPLNPTTHDACSSISYSGISSTANGYDSLEDGAHETAVLLTRERIDPQLGMDSSGHDSAVEIKSQQQYNTNANAASSVVSNRYGSLHGWLGGSDNEVDIRPPPTAPHFVAPAVGYISPVGSRTHTI